MQVSEQLNFKCCGCGKALIAKGYTTGQQVTCPCCRTEMQLSVPATAPPVAQLEVARGPASDGLGVPLKLGLGKTVNFETTVSKKDAGRLGHTFMGGILVALGVLVCAMLGLNFSHRT